MSNEPTQEQPKQPQFVQVEVGFLQAILDYMKKQPYEEVFQFIEVLTGPRNQKPPQGMPTPPQAPPSNISEVTPEGFDATASTGENNE
jgi:hypothetical protein